MINSVCPPSLLRLNFGIWWALCPPDDSRFAKGKAAIAVGSLDKLPMVIDVFAKAVRAGELDEQLTRRTNLPDRFHHGRPPSGDCELQENSYREICRHSSTCRHV